MLFCKYSSASSVSLCTSPAGRPLQKPGLCSPCYLLIDRASRRWGEVDGDGDGDAWQSYVTEAAESLMWEPLAYGFSRGMEAHVGCVAWTNRALCVFECMPLLPYYQFEVWFAGDDINDKQSALVSSSGMETAALNFNNFSIHPLWMKTLGT